MANLEGIERLFVLLPHEQQRVRLTFNGRQTSALTTQLIRTALDHNAELLRVQPEQRDLESLFNEVNHAT